MVKYLGNNKNKKKAIISITTLGLFIIILGIIINILTESKIEYDQIVLEKGGKFDLKRELNLDDNDQIIIENQEIVGITKDGELIGYKPGNTTITIIDKKYKKKTIRIEIISHNKQVFTLSKTQHEFDLSSNDIELKLIAKLNNNIIDDSLITWHSSNEDVVIVTNGKVTAKNIGVATITAIYNNTTTNCDITVIKTKVSSNEILATDIEIEKANYNLDLSNKKNTIKISTTILPDTTTNKKVLWSSSNPYIASVDDDGIVTAKATGTTKITAKTSNGKTATCTVTVTKSSSIKTTVSAESISLNKNTASIVSGKTLTLTATIFPSNTTNKTVTWTSSNTNVATVSNGVVTAKATGTTKITAKTSNGKTATCTVTVTTLPTGISINQSNPTIYLYNKNKNYQLTATVSPSNASDKTVTWTSSNTNVATVSNGVVTAKFPGTTKITAKTSNGMSATTTITVMQREIIIIGASQVARMNQSKFSYTNGNNIYVYNDNLHYIYKSGTGMDWQTREGWNAVTDIINKYSNVKKYVQLYIYFPLVGNTIMNMSCNAITTSNSDINKYASNYNSKIQSLKNMGYEVYGYVTSMHPVKPTQATNSNTVRNDNVNACNAGYRSNIKYYTFNKAFKSIVQSKYSSNLKYESLFIKIMDVNSDPVTFSYKVTYNTTDGVHWDTATTIYYINLMLDYYGVL